MNKKNSIAVEKNFLTIVKSHLQDDCIGCKKLEKKEEFEVKIVPDEVQSLLAEFTNITPSEMLDDVPHL